jgi:hypothetical protein
LVQVKTIVERSEMYVKRKADIAMLESIDKEIVFSMIEVGKSIANVCIEMGISKRALDTWIEDNGYEPDILRARVRAADLLACETVEIADTISDDNPSKPMHRIRTRQWLAERWDAKTYGAKQAAVTVNIGNLRLDALRQLEVVEDLSTGETPSL